MCSRPCPCSATRWRWCTTPKAWTTSAWPPSRAGRICPRPRSCCRPPTPQPTTACASSRPAANCPLPATRRWAAATPGWRQAASRATPAWVVQQCGVGLVRVRRSGTRLAFAAPPRRRSGPLDEALLARIARGLRLADGAVRAHQWVDNGPGWCAVLLDSAERVRALQPDWSALAGAEAGHRRPATRRQRHAVRAARTDRRRRLRRPGHRQPERQRGAVADRRGAGAAALRRVAGLGAAPRRARSSSMQLGDDIWVGGDIAPLIHGEVDL